MKLSIESLNSEYKGKKIFDTFLREVFHDNLDDEYIAYCSDFDERLRERYNITEKLYQKWEYDYISFNVYLYLSEGVITSIEIHKYRTDGEYGGKSMDNELTPTQQELRIADRVISSVLYSEMSESFLRLKYKPCRNCGELVDRMDYYKNKLCPHCGQPSAPKNIKQLHIAFGESQAGYLKVSSNFDGLEHNIDYKTIFLTYKMDMGDISSCPISNANLYPHSYSLAEECAEFCKKQLEEVCAFDNDVDIYLWAQVNDTDAYLSMLFFAKEFKRFNNVYIVEIYKKGEDARKGYEPISALKDKVKLSTSDLDNMYNEYLRIAGLGDGLRITSEGKTDVYPYDYFDEDVLNCIIKKHKNFNAIFSQVFDYMKKEYDFSISYSQFGEIINRLCIQGKIEPAYNYGWGLGSAMMLESSFRLRTNRETPDKFLQMEYLMSAFEYGCTYELYEQLADDVEYYSEDTNKSVKGAKNVIDFFERISVLLEREASTIKCDFCRPVVNREDYDNNIYILLKYVNRDESSLVDVRFNNDKINKIIIKKLKNFFDVEVFEPADEEDDRELGVSKDSPYYEVLLSQINAINRVIPLKEEEQVLIFIRLNTEEKIIKWNEWIKGRLKGENSLDATANEIVQAAVHISKELDS